MSAKNMNVSTEVQQVLKIPIKYVHVMRNPYDNIATMLLRALNKRTEASKGAKVTCFLFRAYRSAHLYPGLIATAKKSVNGSLLCLLSLSSGIIF